MESLNCETRGKLMSPYYRLSGRAGSVGRARRRREKKLRGKK
jgi:hypothetical protein